VSVWAQLSSSLFSSPYSLLAYTPFSTRLAAGYDLLPGSARNTRSRNSVGHDPYRRGANIAVTGRGPWLKSRSARAASFQRALANGVSRHRSDSAVLIVAPLSGHHATLLRDTVRTLLPEHEVYITDWI